MEENGTKERIKQYIRYLGLSMAEFTDSIGVSRSYINSIHKTISGEVFAKIQNQYPGISRDWLLFGEGDMIVKTSEPVPATDKLQAVIIKQQETIYKLVEINQSLLVRNEHLEQQLLASDPTRNRDI